MIALCDEFLGAVARSVVDQEEGDVFEVGIRDGLEHARELADLIVDGDVEDGLHDALSRGAAKRRKWLASWGARRTMRPLSGSSGGSQRARKRSLGK